MRRRRRCTGPPAPTTSTSPTRSSTPAPTSKPPADPSAPHWTTRSGTAAGRSPAASSSAAPGWTSCGTLPPWASCPGSRTSSPQRPHQVPSRSTRRSGKPATAANAAPPNTCSGTARTSTPPSSTPTAPHSTLPPAPVPAATSSPPGYANRARNPATRRDRIGGTDGSCRAVEITAPRLADRGDGAAGDEDEHADHDEHHGNQPVADPAEPGDHLPVASQQRPRGAPHPDQHQEQRNGYQRAGGVHAAKHRCE